MASAQMALGPTNVVIHEYETSSESDDSENIPYHARQNAMPFSYGAVPDGFGPSDLNHVVIEEVMEIPKPKPIINPPSPSVVRKTTRPSISPSRPVLRKTPSRKEFEEMLLERREQALRDQNIFAIQQAQTAAIQKDLDELQEKLNKSIRVSQSDRPPLPISTEQNTSKDLVCIDDSIKSTFAKQYFEPTLLIADTKRSETPTFPISPQSEATDRCMSPYPTVAVKSITNDDNKIKPDKTTLENTREVRSTETQEVEPHLVKFAKDLSEYWYKPHMSREDAVELLRNTPPGTFLIRKSTTYQNAYGLVLRVSKPPPKVAGSLNNGDELVRHFLLEPTTRGVHLKGCSNEPVFTSLSAFVYQHSINQFALPCTLLIPDRDLLLSSVDADFVNRQKQILSQGAACNLLYLFVCDMESLTGDEAVRKAVYEMYSQSNLPKPLEVHFKVSQQGVTLTDNTRTAFFRRHYASQCISHFGLDPDARYWSVIAKDEGLERAVNKSIFAFVARSLTGTKDNQCHVFCDLAASQPASAIVSFANKVLPLNKSNHNML